MVAHITEAYHTQSKYAKLENMSGTINILQGNQGGILGHICLLREQNVLLTKRVDQLILAEPSRSRSRTRIMRSDSPRGPC